jgi:S-adenosylmethionine synthetase
MGEITTTANVNYEAIARTTIKDIGYDNPATGIDYKSCKIIVAIDEQSPDISQAVTTALEVRGDGKESIDDAANLGAGDQGMMVGFACDETPELMPLTIDLSHRLTHQLSIIRKEGSISYLRPDGKAQVTIEYAYGKPKRIHTIIVSTQHEAGVAQETISADIIEHVIKPIIPSSLLDESTRILVNPSGSFVIGGPHGDTGLTGRKILVDTYGGVARHGGGAFSGKDPTKVDRSAAYAARYVAKNIVAAGLASRCEVQVSYAIGVAKPIAVSVETFATNRFPNEVIDQIVASQFDLRPGAIIQNLQLRQPIYQMTAAYGHFGRSDVNFPWEQTDKSEQIRIDVEKITK